MHYVSGSCKGEECGLCFRSDKEHEPATHKVGEEIQVDELVGLQFLLDPYASEFRHNLTQYVCCDCFGAIMGPTAIQWCRGVTSAKLESEGNS